MDIRCTSEIMAKIPSEQINIALVTVSYIIGAPLMEINFVYN